MIAISKILMGLPLFLFIFSFHIFASDHIIVYNTSDRFAEINLLKRYLEKNKLKVSVYSKVDSMERHIDNLNKINNSNASFLIALNIELEDKEEFYIAIPDIKGMPSKAQGRFNFIEEIPVKYEKDFKELAMAVASSFNTKIKTMPIFCAVGLEMPCIFVSITTKKDNMNMAFERLYGGIKSYLTRGEKNER